MGEVRDDDKVIESIEMLPLYMVRAGTSMTTIRSTDLSEGPLESLLARKSPEENVFLVQFTGIAGSVKLTLLAGPETSRATDIVC